MQNPLELFQFINTTFCALPKCKTNVKYVTHLFPECSYKFAILNRYSRTASSVPIPEAGLSDRKKNNISANLRFPDFYYVYVFTGHSLRSLHFKCFGIKTPRPFMSVS